MKEKQETQNSKNTPPSQPSRVPASPARPDPLPSPEEGLSALKAPESSDWFSPEVNKAFIKACETARLSLEQAEQLQQAFVAWIDKALAEEEARDTEELEAFHRKLKERWGKDFSLREQAAGRMAKAFGLEPEALQVLYALGDPFSVLDALAEMGLNIREDSFAGARSGQRGISAGEARAELERLKSDKAHVSAFTNPAHPHHEAAKRRRAELLAWAAPSGLSSSAKV